MPPKVSLLKLTQGQAVKELYEKNHFIQDMLVPLSNMKEALEVFHKEVKVRKINSNKNSKDHFYTLQETTQWQNQNPKHKKPEECWSCELTVERIEWP